ncbi:MAG: magnesium/cobalt transporter CorA [Myxococcales bacterium]|nr:magnesium/cobalt transporter CorA [Myxococcales bacterium]
MTEPPNPNELDLEHLDSEAELFEEDSEPAPPPPMRGSPLSTSIHLVAYGPDEFVEKLIVDPALIGNYLGKYPVTWVHVTGLYNLRVVQQLGDLFHLHHLVVEDVLHTAQRIKAEEYDTGRFIVARALSSAHRVETHQLSFFIGADFLLTFEERSSPHAAEVRDRLRAGRGKARKSGPDFLAYCLLDTVIDFYFPVLDGYGERLQRLEGKLLDKARVGFYTQIHRRKLELLTLRRAVRPLDEAIRSLLREKDELITPETQDHLRDCQDHTLKIVELTDTYRDIAQSLMDLYFFSLSHQMNEVMKVLTMIATIFIPLSFVAGIYGMNFNTAVSPLNMPELNWFFGYPFAMAIMIAVAVGMLYYFKTKGWLGTPRKPKRKIARKTPLPPAPRRRTG